MSLFDPLNKSPIVKMIVSLLGTQADRDQQQRLTLADRQHRDEMKLGHARLEAASRYAFAKLHAESQLANREMDLRETRQRIDLAERAGLFQAIEGIALMAMNTLNPLAFRLKALDTLVQLTREQTQRSLGRGRQVIDQQLPSAQKHLRLQDFRREEDDD